MINNYKRLYFTEKQAAIMTLLYFNDKMTASEIKNTLCYTQGTVSNIIRRLIGLGLAERLYPRDDFDRRIRYFSLTEAGKETAKEMINNNGGKI